MIWLAAASALLGAAATATDLRARVIPNRLTAAGFAVGLALHALLWGWAGLGASLGGAAVGFAVFLIFFLLGGMGGGDIKLMTAYGALLGLDRIVTAAFLTAILGGLMALGRLGWTRARGRREAAAAKPSIPYAPAIAAGALLTFLAEDEIWRAIR